jgi:hypothetical protein
MKEILIWNFDKINCQVKYKIVGEKPVRLPLCLPQTPREMPWDQALTSEILMWLYMFVLKYYCAKHWVVN